MSAVRRPVDVIKGERNRNDIVRKLFWPEKGCEGSFGDTAKKVGTSAKCGDKE